VLETRHLFSKSLAESLHICMPSEQGAVMAASHLENLRRDPNNHRLAIAAVSARCLAHLAALRTAVHYVRAAHRDEQNNFPYAAALEWRKAAELFSSDTPVAEYCWRQWERIMQLPRWLAGPISDSSGFAPAGDPAFVLDPAGAGGLSYSALTA
jgi:hypothetical protein